MKRIKTLQKGLSLFLTVIMLVGMLSVGIVLPETRLTASAVGVNSLDSLISAINAANNAAAGTVTTITLTGDIIVESTTPANSTPALTPITKSVILDLSGHNLTFQYILDDNSWDNNYKAQLPKELQSEGTPRNFVNKGMLNVASSGSLQVINSGGSAGIYVKTSIWAKDKASTGWHKRPTMCASSSGIYSEGTLIIGDRYDSTKNDVTIYTSALTGTNDKGYDRNCTANSYAVTMKGENTAQFVMYGGALKSVARTRTNYNGYHKGRCFPLNVQSCYSAEVYGGSIDIPYDDECGLRNSDETASDGADSLYYCIRSNSPNVYIFNVNSDVHIYVGADTGKDNTAYTANIYSTQVENAVDVNAVHLYGGYFTNNSARAGGDSTAKCNKKIISGNYRKAEGANGINPSAVSSYTTDAELTAATMFVLDGTSAVSPHASNGIYPWDYPTFHDFVISYTQSADVYYGNGKITTLVNSSGTSVPPPTTFDYRCSGYVHTAWKGKRMPYWNYGTQTDDITLNGGASGSLFLAPLWTENTYNIAYEKNDDDGGVTKAVIPHECPTSYKISGNSVLAAPTRVGYNFTGWLLTEVTYLQTDDHTADSPWKQGQIYPAGTSLHGKYGNLKFEAQWEDIQYSATFELDGGTYSGSTADIVLHYTVNNGFNFPAGVTRAYYNFNDYWKCTQGDGFWQSGNTLYTAGSASQVSTSVNPVYGNPRFRAQYTPHTYTVTYKYNDNKTADTQGTYNIESTDTLPPAVRNGYSFLGWKPEADVDDCWDSSQTYAAGTSFSGKHGDVTLVAQWAEVVYTLEVQLAAGENLAGGTSHHYRYDNPPTLGVPTKTGFTFNGWEVVSASVGEDGQQPTWTVGERFLPDTPGAAAPIPGGKIGNAVIKPLWNINTYHLEYEENGGTACADRDFTIQDSIDLALPTKNGYSFDGWDVVSSNEGNWVGSYSAPQALTGMWGDVRLKADWSAANYMVRLNANGGSVSSTELSYDTEHQLPLPQPVREGFAFRGWEVTNPAANTSWQSGHIYTDSLPVGEYGDLDLTAVWEHEQYSITFTGAGQNPGMMYYYVDSESFCLPAGVSAGHSFRCWRVLADIGNWNEGETISPTTSISARRGNVTLASEFDVINYVITYLNKDGTEYGRQDYNIENPFDIGTYSEYGYQFDGWEVVDFVGEGSWSLHSEIQPGSVPAGLYYGNVTLAPVLTPINYTATFISDGGTSYPPLSYNIESEALLPAPEKLDHDFAGWRVTEPDGNWAQDAVINGGTPLAGHWGDVKLTAQWTPKQYDITWHLSDDRQEVTQASYGSNPVFDDTPTKPDDPQYTYTFAGWRDADNNEYRSGTPLPAVSGNAEYWALYDETLRSYTVTFTYATDEVGHTETKTYTCPYGTVPQYENGAIPVKTSSNSEHHEWRFVGWDSEVVPVRGDAVYMAEFKKVFSPRPVVWVINGVRYPTSWGVGEMPEYGGTPSKPDEGGYRYTFAGWNPEVIPVEAGQDYEYEAQFTREPQTYNARFNLAGGTASFATHTTYDMVNGLELGTPVKTAYTFGGWRAVSCDPPGGTWVVGSTYSAETWTRLWGDVEFIAQWTPIDYTVSFNDPAGYAPPDSITYNIESTQTLPEDITRPGYTLSGWLVSTGGGNWAQGDTLEKNKSLTGMYGNVTLSPIWTVKSYTIHWVSGDITQDSHVYFGDPINPYEPVPRAGYTAAWDLEIPAVMPDYDLTFHAVYTPIQYYLRFNSNGGSPVEPFYYDSDSSALLPTPTREGADFLGWKVVSGNGSWIRNTFVPGGASLHGRYGDAILVAQWQLHTITIIWNAGDVTKTTQWLYGSMPFFDGTPYKSLDEHHSYTFDRWDPVIVPATADAEYTAIFNETERKYTVIWNIDGHETRQDDAYSYGDTPSFPGHSEPERAETPEYQFVFSGWSPAVSNVSADITYTAQFDVIVKLLGLNIDRSAVFLEVGGEEKVNAIILPDNASNRDIVWSSLDESIATVDGEGNITGVAPGQALVRVSSVDSRFNAYCVVTVSPIFSEQIIVSAGGLSTSRFEGDTIILTATVYPENTTNRTLTWSSSDPAVASVDPDTGVVTYGSVLGEATITAVCDGYAFGTITVTTTENPDEVQDEVPAYTVIFARGESRYMINGYKCYSARLVYPEGATVEFKPVTPYYVLINGVQADCESDGWYRIRDIHQNYTINVIKYDGGGLPDDDPATPVRPSTSFMQKIIAFFNRIIQFFKRLFGIN